MPPPLRALAEPLADADLLGRYARDRDPAAFEVLVWRHGPRVLGVCRRHLPADDADDAFQATFLVLARKAATVRADTLPGWLHRVARRTAVRAASKARRRRETPMVADPPARPPADPELGTILDAEIDRLPDRLRQVVVLCYLDGVSTEAAAARLGVPRGTVLSRLHAARAALRDRLRRRGVTPPAVGLLAAVTASQVAGGVRATHGANAAATLLANEVLVMGTRKLVACVAMGLVLAGGAGTGWGVLSAQSGGPPAGMPEPAARRPQPEQPGRPAAVEAANKRDEGRKAAMERLAAAENVAHLLDSQIAKRRTQVRQLEDQAADTGDPAGLHEEAASLRRDIYTGRRRERELDRRIARIKAQFGRPEPVASLRQKLEADQDDLRDVHADLLADREELAKLEQRIRMRQHIEGRIRVEAEELQPLVESRAALAREVVQLQRRAESPDAPQPAEDKLDVILAELRAVRAKLDARP